MDISRKTWKYLHGPDDTVHLSFSTGGVPRSFSVIQYASLELEEIDFNCNGIAIIDNDALSVVIDEHLEHETVEQIRFMSSVRKMDWKTFSSFCIEHPRYRDQAQDMKKARPDPGVVVNQIQRGVIHMPTSQKDLRSPSMVAAHADPDCVYDFPPNSTRSRMIIDLLSHDSIKDENGLWRISWNPGFDKALLNSGFGSSHTDQSMDSNNDWSRHYKDNPEIRHKIIGDVLESFFSGRIGTWPKTDAGRYAFVSGGTENPDMVCLATFDGVDLGFESRGKIGAFLDQLEDLGVRDLWKLVRVVDHDLSQPVIDAACEIGLEQARVDFEQDQGKSMEPGP